MRDLSFQEALEAADLPFRKFVADCVDLWNRAVTAYETAGSPNGPAGENSNVTDWFLARMDALDAVSEALDLLGLHDAG